MKKAVVVGGLGYLGYEVVRILMQTAGVDSVLVIDNNMYGKWEEHELEELSVELSIKNVLHYNFDEIITTDVSCVFVCSTIDVSSFYNAHTLQHCERYFDWMNAFCEHCVSHGIQFIHPFTHTGHVTLPEFLEEHTLDCPVLYGTAPAFRSDTLINNMVLSFALEKMYGMEDNPLQDVTFCNVVEYANALVQGKIPDIARVPMIGLVNIIQWMYGPEYSIHMPHIPDIAKTYQYQVSLHKKDFDTLELFVNEIKRGIEVGHVEELCKEQYNNVSVLSGIVNSLKYKGRLD